jgi:DNA-binding transcriptional ArsR family regulator
MKSENLRTTLRVMKALSDIQRLRIMMMLRAGELCVCQIIAVLDLAPSTVSKHLSLLSTADLVVSRKEGRWAYYRLPNGAKLKTVKPLLAWLEIALKQDERLLKDDKKLQAVLACPPGYFRTRRGGGDTCGN